MSSGKKINKGTGLYKKYRDLHGSTTSPDKRPQRTGVNKETGKDTGSYQSAKTYRSKRLEKYVDMILSHKNPNWAIQKLVPRSYIADVASRLADEGAQLSKKDK